MFFLGILGKLKRRNTTNSRNRFAGAFKRSLFNAQHPHIQQFSHLRHLQHLQQYNLQQAQLSNLPHAALTGLHQPPINGTQLPFPIPPLHQFNLSSSMPTAGSNNDNSILQNSNPHLNTNASNSMPSQLSSQIPTIPSTQSATNTTTATNPFLAALSKNFFNQHPLHDRLLNVPPFLPPLPNQINNNNSAINKTTSNAGNLLKPTNSTNQKLKKESNKNEKDTAQLPATTTDNLHSNAPLHLQPFLRSLSEQMNKFPINPFLPPNFPMLQQSMHQLLNQSLLNNPNLNPMMLNQSTNQINHSLNSNSSLISSTSSSPTFNKSTNESDSKADSKSQMTKNNFLNKLSKTELNSSLNINVDEDEEDFEVLDLENDAESVENLELDVDDDYESLEDGKKLMDEEMTEKERPISSNLIENKEFNNDLMVRSRSTQNELINSMNSASSLLANNSLPSKPIAVHPLKQQSPFSVESQISNNHCIGNLPSNPSLLPSHLNNQLLNNSLHSLSTSPSTVHKTSPFYNATSFLQHPILPSTDRNINPNTFCNLNPWPFSFDSNSSTALQAAKLSVAQFLNNNNNSNNKQESK